DPVALHLAVVEGGAAVAAARVDETGAAPAIAEEDEVLAEDAHLPWNAPRLRRQRDGMPVAPQHLAAGCARSDQDQVGVVARLRQPVGRPGVHGLPGLPRARPRLPDRESVEPGGVVAEHLAADIGWQVAELLLDVLAG